MSGMFKDFGAGEAVTGLISGISQATKFASESGNPGGDGKLVEVKMDGAIPSSGTATVEKGARFAVVAGWGDLPALTPSNYMLAWTVGTTTLTVKGPNSYSGTIFFWVHN